MKRLSARGLLLGSGLALALAIGAIALTVPSPSGALTVYAAENPRLGAEEWLRQNGGSTCSERPIVEYRVSRELLASADEPEAANSWLNPGDDTAYVGDIAAASFAEVSGSIAVGSAEAWLIGKDARGPFVAQYRRFTTPMGRSLWLKTSWERPLPESACQS